MRTVVSYELLSLDGVAESPDSFIHDWDAVVDAHLSDVIASQDAVVLGRGSYEEWARFWPTSDVEPFATFINGVQKYVATSTPLGDWANATRIEGDLAAFVRDLRDQPGGEIGVHASISLVRSMLTDGLVDELKLVIAPTVAGSGRRLLDGVPTTRLELLGAESTPSGHLLAHYRVLREQDAPRG
jgi:dihydrofolate reductase